MPLEVTPPPFSASQRLPYVPPVPKLESGGGSAFLSGASSLGRHGPGPVAAASSTIIPPAPGGMAGPHRAIPALPEAGYTSALAGMQGLSIGAQAPPSLYGDSAYNSYAPRSVYDFDPHEQQHHHQHVHSPLTVVQSENDWATASSLPAPRPRLAPESMIATRHGHHHHHRHHYHQDVNDDNFDRQTDASYYAMPRHRGGRSRAGSASSASDSEDAREPTGEHHRSHSIGHSKHIYKHQRSPSLPAHNAIGNGRFHSPSSSSPLAGVAPPSYHGKSPLALADPYEAEKGQRRPFPAPDEEKRQRIHSYVPSDGERDRGHEPRTKEQDLREAERGRRHSSGVFEGERPQMRRHKSAQLPAQHQYYHQHGRHRSGSYHLPQDIYGRDQSPPPPPSSVGGPASAMGMGQFPQDMGAGHYQRRRAVSMQGFERPPPSYQPASVYDDVASVASHESNLTFMEGSVAGKTSQYGLPKYPHQTKMDYRRFCIQRGNADVFLD
ncbi:hypothetical protein IAR50_000442 [Cryptococcus sp. DSM 104548]